MEQFIWKSGETPERSHKSDNPNIKKKQTPPQSIAMQEGSDFNQQCMAMTGISRMEMDLGMAEMNQDSNRRDSMNGKLSDRRMIQQVGQNPFHTGNSYINDLEVQEQFLRPKSSHTELNETAQ
tara:strand:+ start:585 stop:953 length:369 start_codon:yes stop_codon:yes gene_type:complete